MVPIDLLGKEFIKNFVIGGKVSFKFVKPFILVADRLFYILYSGSIIQISMGHNACQIELTIY